MPTKKNRLTQTERDEYLAAAQQLQSQGLITELPTEWKELGESFVIQVGKLSTIYVLAPGQILYAVYARLVSRTNNFALTHFDIVPYWDEGISCSYDETTYSFARGRLEFEYDSVLNHRFEKLFRLGHEGERVEGWFLGTGLHPVPKEYGPGKPAPLTLRFFDQKGRASDTNTLIGVNRDARVPAWFNEIDVPATTRPAETESRKEPKIADFPYADRNENTTQPLATKENDSVENGTIAGRVGGGA